MEKNVDDRKVHSDCGLSFVLSAKEPFSNISMASDNKSSMEFNWDSLKLLFQKAAKQETKKLYL